MAEKAAKNLVQSGLDKAKLAEVKSLLKNLGQSQAGEKAELAERLRLFVEGAAVCGDAPNPATLKIGELRKELAKRGLPCDTSIETRDELLRRLVDTLKRSAPPAGGGSASGAGAAADAIGTGESAEVLLAKRVLELAETGEDEAILTLGADSAISRESTVAAMRKAYLTLSRSIHPDKLRSFADATKA